jgi:aryl-alcohol dehydrogenase-like predicted oxidoreductase
MAENGGGSVIAKQAFGATGHQSTRLIFGAAALASATQKQADQALDLLLQLGINHIDAAASYGDAELRIGPWMARYRDRFFLASKTGERRYAEARAQIRRSLDRLRVDQLDLIQLHNLVKPAEWETAFGADGALRAAVEAREQGLVRFIGVTGHGTRVPRMHLQSLQRFPFDSVLLPYNYAMMANAEYAAAFDELLGVCAQRNVAVQTIKAVARRRWREQETPTTTTWYKAFDQPEDIARAILWALQRPGIFVNSASDLNLLPHIARAAEMFETEPKTDAETMDAMSKRLEVEPLFISGYSASV